MTDPGACTITASGIEAVRGKAGMKGFIRLEKKYGVKIAEDNLYNPLTGKFTKRFKMYSADWCLWENGLTKEGVKEECKTWGESLMNIKKGAETNDSEKV